ncbi:hypothetical protein HYQ46_005604 [Verticillium longisporum]|nr:hypothetical protein HYQ46_005604 [Verticillium longisporum]
MTLFEHSLAFAEADSAISNQLGWSSFALKQAQTTEAGASVGNAIAISREMDFYTALLRTGFGAITMASEAVYLNEDRDVNLASSTWIEDERFRELEELRRQWLGEEFGSRLDPTGKANLMPVTEGRALAKSGFDRERAAQKLPKTISGEGRLRDGIGAAERSGRWLMALDFVLNTSKLVVRTTTGLVIRLLSRLG